MDTSANIITTMGIIPDRGFPRFQALAFPRSQRPRWECI